MEGWFYFDDTAQAKEIKVVMKDVAKNAYVYETTKTVDYRWQEKTPSESGKEEGVTEIPGTYTWDIELDQIKGSKTKDVWWQQVNSTERYLVAIDRAKLSLITGIGFDQIGIENLRKLPYDLTKISGSDNASQLRPGTLLGIQTNEGNFAKVEILPSKSVRTLIVRWKLYRTSSQGRQAASVTKSQPVKTDSVKQYGGLWYYADPWGRPDDRIVVLEGRFDNPVVFSVRVLSFLPEPPQQVLRLLAEEWGRIPKAPGAVQLFLALSLGELIPRDKEALKILVEGRAEPVPGVLRDLLAQVGPWHTEERPDLAVATLIMAFGLDAVTDPAYMQHMMKSVFGEGRGKFEFALKQVCKLLDDGVAGPGNTP